LAKGITADGTLVGILQSLQQAQSGNGDYLWKAEKWFIGASL
jgi:hypothetical protein